MEFHNKYIAIRHGESKANTAELIISGLEEGKKEQYTLTEEGEKQVRESVFSTKENEKFDNNILIISSPFSRCRKTAEIVKDILEIDNEIYFDDRLRERFFGNFEAMHNSNYQKVWTDDKINPNHNNFNVESAVSVQNRVKELILELENKYQDKIIILSSHGDTLQILQTWFLDKSASEHRDINHLNVAEIRKLN